VPALKRPEVLSAVYAAAGGKIAARDIPTLFVQGGQTLYRSVNPAGTYTSMPKPNPGRHLSKFAANAAITPADGVLDLGNRFSGPSGGSIPHASGLYCVQQQQALINESAHYSGKAHAWSLSGRCVLRIRVMGSILVADLSPHNPRALRFLRELHGASWDQMVDPNDCSVGRGIGLAIAHSGYLRGLSIQTVRESDRSIDENGDNLVLFGSPGQPIPGLYIDQAIYFGKTAVPEIFSVAFP